MVVDEAVTGLPGRRLVAGIGFRRGATAREIAAVIDRALAEVEAQARDLRVIATALDRADEPAIREAAAGFGLAPTGIDPDTLTAQDARVPTRSARIVAMRGVGSLCEAAALAAAGPGGHLVLARMAVGSVTCALAFGPETHDKPER